VYLTLPLVELFGVQIAWVKLVVVASFVACLVLTAVAARLLGAGRWATVVLCAAALVFTKPYGIGLYQPLASVLTLAGLAAVLAWEAALATGGSRRRERTLVALAGAAAGLSFATKHNIGIYTLGAVLGAILVLGAGRRVASALLALGGFAVCALLPLVPVAAQGALDDFYGYGFGDLGTYNEYGSVSYLEGMRGSAAEARDLVSAGSLFDAAFPAYQVVLYLLVPAMLAALALAWWRSAGRTRGLVTVVGVFALAAAAGIFPRADPAHVAFAAPVLLVAGWYALHLLLPSLPAPWPAVVAVGIAVALVPGVLLRAAWPAVQTTSRDAELSSLPYLRGVLLDPARERGLRRAGEQLAALGEEGSLFIASDAAGNYYLVSGVQNPTPFDFPLVTAMGPTGEDEVIEAVRAGEIDLVCVGFRRGEILAPLRLLQTVEETMERAPRTRACRVYRERPG
jgi:4-amino-4-deoxy-L-arabinose transferase-like glycosyltransferase